MLPAAVLEFPTEMVLIADLKPHPRNYRQHPADQLEHLKESIREHGVYKNIVIARENTILAGHGIYYAARAMGMRELPCHRMPLDPDEPRALKLVTGDNEGGHLAEVDDRLLTELLKEIKEQDAVGLLGTGYDERMLANLAFVTRPASEIADHNEAAEWVGMPDYEPVDDPLQLIVSFRDIADREQFIQMLDVSVYKKSAKTWSIQWPQVEKHRQDLGSLRFQG